VLAHRERFAPRQTQRELSIARFKSPTAYKGSLPAAGTYARHNAVDTPALLPDGTMAANSVPKPLAARGSLRPVDTADQAEVEALAKGEAVVVEGGEQA